MICIVITYLQVGGLQTPFRPGGAVDYGLNVFKWRNLDFENGALNAYLDHQKNDLCYKTSDIEEN